MLNDNNVFNLLQRKELIENASNNILITEMSGQVYSEEFTENSQKFRLRGTNEGTLCVDYLHQFDFEMPLINFKKSITFFKPLGFYYFEKPLKPAFFISNEFEEVAKNQDTLSSEKKRINIYYSNDNLAKGLVATFSAENKFVLNNLFDLAKSSIEEKITTPDSVFLTKSYNYILSINKVKLRYLSTFDHPMIQVYLTDEYKINYPLAALIEKDKMKVVPNLNKEFNILSGQGVLSFDQI